MQQLTQAALLVQWASRQEAERVDFQFNPTELSYDKGAQYAEIAIPGLDSPLQQFVRGNAERLSLDLFFDSTDEKGMGQGAESVTKYTDKIYRLVKIEPERHAPPICTFVWNDKFPGSSLGQPSGPAATGAAGGAPGASQGNQSRNGFKCIVESVKQKFTLFSPEGVPLRATLTVALREYKTLDEQLAQLNLSSPDRTHSHVLQRGETLAAVAARYYRRPGDWRAIALANAIEDPRRLTPGTFLSIPPTAAKAKR